MPMRASSASPERMMRRVGMVKTWVGQPEL